MCGEEGGGRKWSICKIGVKKIQPYVLIFLLNKREMKTKAQNWKLTVVKGKEDMEWG